jgi:hypothetical protein
MRSGYHLHLSALSPNKRGGERRYRCIALVFQASNFRAMLATIFCGIPRRA